MEKKCVNALKGATFISTVARYTLACDRRGCVNALKGATFISTKKAEVYYER